MLLLLSCGGIAVAPLRRAVDRDALMQPHLSWSGSQRRFRVAARLGKGGKKSSLFSSTSR
jgi:hypothetical protein